MVMLGLIPLGAALFAITFFLICSLIGLMKQWENDGKQIASDPERRRTAAQQTERGG
jgi:hypothetical protein